MHKSCRFLIMAAGTGGHVFPALAVAQKLIENNHHVEWLGTPLGMEAKLIAKKNIPFHAVSMRGFRGKSFINKLIMPILLAKSFFQAIVVLRKVNPSVVVGFGGYISVPGGLATKILGKKLLIHEQNSVAGSANRLLAKLSDEAFSAYPNVLPKVTCIGNPIRESIKALYVMPKNENIKKKKNILIMGGSLGAEAINSVVPGVLSDLNNSTPLNVWHQTGKNKCADTRARYQQLGQLAKIEEFIVDVEAAYVWADIIICRAGALTVSELTVAGLPAIFIPYPYAIDNHQYFNAKWLVDNQASFLIEQKELTEQKLKNTLNKLLGQEGLLEKCSAAMRGLAKLDATEKLVSSCEYFCEGEKYAA